MNSPSVSTAKTAMITKRAIYIPYSRMFCLSTFCKSLTIMMGLSSAGRGHVHDLFLGRLGDGQLARDPPRGDDVHPVAHPQHFRQLGGDHDDAHALLHQPVHDG